MMGDRRSQNRALAGLAVDVRPDWNVQVVLAAIGRLDHLPFSRVMHAVAAAIEDPAGLPAHISNPPRPAPPPTPRTPVRPNPAPNPSDWATKARAAARKDMP